MTRKSLPQPEPTRSKRKRGTSIPVHSPQPAGRQRHKRPRRRRTRRLKKPDLQFLIGEARAEGHSVLYGMREREEWVCFIDGDIAFTARTELGLAYRLARWLDARM